MKTDSSYYQLMKSVSWFFFDLFLLGYVEDQSTGLSFRLPGGLEWAIYIEVGPLLLKKPAIFFV